MNLRASGGAPLLLIVLLLAPAPATAAPADDLLALPLEELGQLQVRIATGTPKPQGEAPAATSVITATELDALGVQDIGEALEAVPGLHVSNGSFQYGPRYFIRGIASTYNPHTLVLLNGIPQTSLFLGDRGERLPGFYSLPVGLIERIEVIRGPGSALYGADAFAGVINIITKSPLDLQGGQARLGAGSFDTARAPLLQAGSAGPVRGLVSLSWLRTDGDRNAVITRDAQSNLDALYASAASLAPGPAATATQDIDLRGDFVWSDFRLRLGWMQARDTGTGQGINDALDPGSRFDHHRGNLDFSWLDPGLFPDWHLEARASYLYGDFRNDGLKLYPDGAFGGSFPDGVLGAPNLFEENARADLSALYSGIDGHRLRLGSGFFWGDIFKTTDRTNYLSTSGGLLPRPGGLTDVSDTGAVFQPENQRTGQYLFAQDEWTLATAWELTAGLRYDHFSDVGSTTNPRLALVWRSRPDLTAKLMYGEAFRPPAFLELYGTSNPVALGNPDLKPEKLRSLELALGWKPGDDFSWDLNLYAFRIHDYIDFVQDGSQPTFTARNTARVNGRGLETELRRQLGDSLQLLANYSLQHTRDQSGSPLGLAPRQEAYARAIWSVAPRWLLGTRLNWNGKRERQAGDPRPALAGYTTLDLSLRRALQSDVSLALIVRNLFDAAVTEPSRGPGAGQVLPNLYDDLPQAGRDLLLEASARW